MKMFGFGGGVVELVPSL